MNKQWIYRQMAKIGLCRAFCADAFNKAIKQRKLFHPPQIAKLLALFVEPGADICENQIRVNTIADKIAKELGDETYEQFLRIIRSK